MLESVYMFNSARRRNEAINKQFSDVKATKKYDINIVKNERDILVKIRI